MGVMIVKKLFFCPACQKSIIWLTLVNILLVMKRRVIVQPTSLSQVLKQLCNMQTCMVLHSFWTWMKRKRALKCCLLSHLHPPGYCRYCVKWVGMSDWPEKLRKMSGCPLFQHQKGVCGGGFRCWFMICVWNTRFKLLQFLNLPSVLKE